jgi:hypothetical protein
MDLVKVFAAFGQGFAARRFVDGGEVAEGRGKFAGGNKRGVGGGGSDVVLVAEAATAEDAVEFEGVKRGAFFSWSRCICGWYGWERGGIVMDVGELGRGEGGSCVREEFLIVN